MKKITLTIGMVIIALVATFNLNIVNEDPASILKLANIEALAQNEHIIPPSRSCYKTISFEGSNNPTHVTFCGSCDAQLARSWSDSGTCNSKSPL